MNQREATVNCILSVLEERGVEYELNGPTPIATVLNSDDKHKVRSILITMFQQGKIDFKDSSRLSDDKYMKEYVSGLVNNWIRKAPEFNGNAKYEAKNPGSRAGSGDEQIREMKKLLSTVTDQATKDLIQSHIDARVAEIKPATVSVNYDAIPADLRAKLGL
ncbi:hypothetical protein UFOVP53_202 [uncultured Caudovirales phage]|uniref:Uncharacterized protein n=1 Tax=uncultured Caudovirales phage TaxID=2100421 RepID=A0A6J5KXM4_9CAUD|nr:hypothetical protein UFOVP53_202 [uncultured Caudovirales phage]